MRQIDALGPRPHIGNRNFPPPPQRGLERVQSPERSAKVGPPVVALVRIRAMAAQVAYCIVILDIGPRDPRDIIA
jgi:hypothetical protein